MSRSRARLAADWFAKLRQNAVTNEVEHTDVVDVAVAEASSVQPNDSPTFGIVTATSFVGDGSTLTGISTTPTAAQVGAATAGLPAGAVGTYLWARSYAAGATNYVAGAYSIAGSGLTFINGTGAYNGVNRFSAAPVGQQTGTWINLFWYQPPYHTHGLWLRIS